MTKVNKSNGAIPLYAYRPVMNSESIYKWMQEQGFKSALTLDDMHVTVVFSREPFDANISQMVEMGNTCEWYANERCIVSGGARRVSALGDEGAVVLKLVSLDLLEDHLRFRRMGASWDHESYVPHVTLTYNAQDVDLEAVEPYQGDIILGPLRFVPLTSGNSHPPEQPLLIQKSEGVSCNFEIMKRDEEQRVVWGWAYVSTLGGELQVDTQGDSIEPTEMVLMANDFMKGARYAKAMHVGSPRGEVIHSFPLTVDIAKNFGIQTDKEGWIVGIHLPDDEAWSLTKSSDFKGISIGGRAAEREAY